MDEGRPLAVGRESRRGSRFRFPGAGGVAEPASPAIPVDGKFNRGPLVGELDGIEKRRHGDFYLLLNIAILAMMVMVSSVEPCL